MTRRMQLGVALIVAGVLANNYIFFHDLIFDKHAGAIYLGWRSYLALVVALAAVAAGLVMLLRTDAPHG